MQIVRSHFAKLLKIVLSDLIGSGTFPPRIRYVNMRKEAAMYILAAVVAILLIALAGAELFLAQFNADELSNMGVEKP
jgi:hypothetical protein